MAKMSFDEFKRRVKRAPKKDLMLAAGCVIAVVALTIYYFVAVL